MQIDLIEFFREVTIRISSSLDVTVAMENLHHYLEKYMPVGGSALAYREGDGYYLVAMAGRSFIEPLEITPDSPVLFLAEAEMAEFEREFGNEFVQMKSALIYSPENTRKLINHLGRHLPIWPHNITGMLHCELAIGGQSIGMLSLTAFDGACFNEQHLHAIESVKEPISLAMSNARRYLELSRLKELLVDDNREIRRELLSVTGDQVIGAEFGLRGVMEMVRNVAPLSSPVLLLGETGTGKEVIANTIHQQSPRHDKPLVRVQCGAIPDTLLDSELFGHEKGAFTGAVSQKRGRFERADGGTIFLDEIGELTLEAQVKLLRVLQEREIERLGGLETLKIDVRVIAATHRDLPRMVAEGKFREDLFFRLNVFPIFLPPLRQRLDDIPALAIHFINRKRREMGLAERPVLSMEAICQLQRYKWPGNVRELQNVIERGLITCQGRRLTFDDFLAPSSSQADLAESTLSSVPLQGETVSDPGTMDAAITRQIKAALAKTSGKVHGPGGAADLLKMNPSTLRYQMSKRGIPYGRKAQLAHLMAD